MFLKALFLILSLLSFSAFAQVSYSWSNSGLCQEIAASGRALRLVPEGVCRKMVGTTVDFRPNGKCAEFTPSKTFLYNLPDDSLCRQKYGMKVSWSELGMCQVTSKTGEFRYFIKAEVCRQMFGTKITFKHGCREVTPTGVFLKHMPLSACTSPTNKSAINSQERVSGKDIRSPAVEVRQSRSHARGI